MTHEPPSDALAQTLASEPAAASPPKDPAPGSRLGRYRIEQPLGRGAMAQVYAARDLTLHRPVALKLIRAGDDEAAIHRLVREAQTLARISHPNVVQVFDTGRDDGGLVYIAMERLAGVTLDAYLRERPALRDRLAVFAAAGRGLAAAHDAGLIHRDFKPQNVMVAGPEQVRVLDFGLACAADPDREIDSGGRMGGLLVGLGARATLAGALVGTPAYMSPEQWQGRRADARSDQFAFAVCLYEALAERHPYPCSSRQALREAVLAGAPPPLPRSVPRTLRQVVMRGMALSPEARFPSMHALVRALAAPPQRTRLLLAGSGLVAAAALAWWRLAAPAPAAPERATEVAYLPAQRLTARGDIARAAISPDERQLAFLTAEELWLQPLAQPPTEPRLLARGRFAHDALSWAPDGRELALFGADETSSAPALLRIDVQSGQVERRPLAPGQLAHAGAELAYARFGDDALTLLGASGERRCPLPPPFSGVRSLRYLRARDAFLVQLDHGDRETALLLLDRACQKPRLRTASLPALSTVASDDGEHVLARLMGGGELVELLPDGRPSALHHLVQASDYTPLALLADGSLIHQNHSVRWQLRERDPAGADRELWAGVEQTRFALAPDGTTLAVLAGVYREGALRITSLERPDGPGPTLARAATRATWSPRGDRLALLLQHQRGYQLAVWSRTTGELSEPRTLELPYDTELVWLDEDRVAYVLPPDGRSVRWLAPATGARGELELPGDAPVRSLVRDPDSGDLALVSETEHGLQVWRLPAQGSASLLAELPAASPASRLPQLTWTRAGLVLYARTTGELWRLSARGAEPLPALPLPRSGGFGRLGEVFPFGDRLVYSTLTASGDVYRSIRRDR